MYGAPAGMLCAEAKLRLVDPQHVFRFARQKTVESVSVGTRAKRGLQSGLAEELLIVHKPTKLFEEIHRPKRTRGWLQRNAPDEQQIVRVAQKIPAHLHDGQNKEGNFFVVRWDGNRRSLLGLLEITRAVEGNAGDILGKGGKTTGQSQPKSQLNSLPKV